MEFPVQVFKENAIIVVDCAEKWQEILDKSECIEAAGGIVVNVVGDILLIKRRGKWDFPKGKIEENELVDMAAMREISEETGLTRMQTIQPIAVTFHSYQEKNRHYLKKTTWFLLQTDCQQPLQPQQAEDITKAAWVNQWLVEELLEHSFPLLLHLWQNGQQALSHAMHQQRQ